MAWNGDVKRQIIAIWPRAEGGSRILFDCQHEQNSAFSCERFLDSFRSRPEAVCFACSRPNWDRIAAQRRSFAETIDLLRSEPD